MWSRFSESRKCSTSTWLGSNGNVLPVDQRERLGRSFSHRVVGELQVALRALDEQIVRWVRQQLGLVEVFSKLLPQRGQMGVEQLVRHRDAELLLVAFQEAIDHLIAKQDSSGLPASHWV